MATLYVKAAGGNWSAAGTWSNVNSAGADNSGPPVAGDNCIAELGSGNFTVDSGAVCRSFDTTSGTGTYGGTLTHSTSVTWTIGDGTAGAGNVALKLNSGMVYTKGSTTSSAISFISTSGTQQTITVGTKVLGNVTFNGAGGSWLLSDTFAANGSTSTVLTVTNGTLDLGGQTVTVSNLVAGVGTKTITCGGAVVNIGAAGFATSMDLSAANTTFNANTSTFHVTTSNQSWDTGTKTFNNITLDAGATGTTNLNRAFVCATLTVSAPTSGTLAFNLGPTITTLVCQPAQAYTISFKNGQTTTVTTLTANGAAGYQVTFNSTTAAAIATLALGAAGTGTVSYLTVKDLKATGTNTPINDTVGGVDGGGGCTGWLFPAKVGRRLVSAMQAVNRSGTY